VVKDGRFGAYVTDGETNRTLPRDVTPESITREQAVELLAEKRAQGPKKKPAARKPAAPRKKAATKK
jgi:DNA topoisomerase-1